MNKNTAIFEQSKIEHGIIHEKQLFINFWNVQPQSKEKNTLGFFPLTDFDSIPLDALLPKVT